ncbi:MAG: hypothetical protein WA324_24880, partial [Bryobacteraceae bacterium]
SALQDRPRFFEIFRVAGRRIIRNQALAMVKSEYPRALTVSIAKFLQSLLATTPATSNLHMVPRRQRQPANDKPPPVPLAQAKP